MSDYRDMWKERSDKRRKARLKWWTCINCEIMYGTGTKNPPEAETCSRCGSKKQ